jgi:hypothetical protein
MAWLIVLIFVAVIVVFAWNFRRQTKAREEASAERMRAFLEQARGGTVHAGREPAAPTMPAQAAAREPTRTADTILRAALLDTDLAAAYHQLTQALPDHLIFARVSLAAFVSPAANLSGMARDAVLRRLADSVVDFLVCDRVFKPVAVVQCAPQAVPPADAAAYARQCVSAAGVRWVVLPAQAQSQAAGDALRQQVLQA